MVLGSGQVLWDKVCARGPAPVARAEGSCKCFICIFCSCRVGVIVEGNLIRFEA